MLDIQFDFEETFDQKALARLKEEAAEARLEPAERPLKTGRLLVTDRADVAVKAINKVKGVILINDQSAKVPGSIFRCGPESFRVYLDACITVHY